MRVKERSRLIVSFIGNTDLKYFSIKQDNRPPRQDDNSPIMRLLRGIDNKKLNLGQGIPPSRTRLLLFNENGDNHQARAFFCERIKQELEGMGLDGMEVIDYPITLSDGPTDYDNLYQQVDAAIPRSGPETEVIFHLSSGTPAMHTTLLIAANCLPLGNVHLFETSREKGQDCGGLLSICLPYILAASKTKIPKNINKKLLSEPAKTLLPDTVVSDPFVSESYEALHAIAKSRRKSPARVLVKGAIGTGKWYACRQFAKWCHDIDGAESVEWLEPVCTPEIPLGCTVLIRRIDTWSLDQLQRLSRLAADRRDIAIAATFRTGERSSSPLELIQSEGLCGATLITLPVLRARNDIVQLAEAVARQNGIADGKVRERFQYILMEGMLRNNIHDIRSLLTTAMAYSPSKHPIIDHYQQDINNIIADQLLREAWQTIDSMDFGPGGL
ncbi:MAG: hypothetical protein HQL58_13725, partial [Magnetococcales bacterium]|nr:hypothetical protein [Magnetococcales bacterium]